MDIEAYKHLQKAKCRLIVREECYGMCTTQFDFKESHNIPTMGVKITSNGVEALYNPKFILSLSIEQLYSLLIHECEHILRMHLYRFKYIERRVCKATDMAINGKRSNPTCCYIDEDKHAIVVSEDGIYIPEEWEEHGTAEYYYNLLPDDDEKSNDGHNDESFDDHSTWKDSDLSEDEIRQVVKNLLEEAISNCSKDNVPGHMQEYLKSLSKPIIKWRNIIRMFIGRNVNGRRLTFSRRNRRNDIFGIKGVSHHATATIGIIIDTSGSITSDELKQFFTEIEVIASKARIWLLQWDANFIDYCNKYRRGDWKRIVIKGRGGTRMDLSQKWVIENGIKADALIMLTDGETNWHDNIMPMPFIVCLTQDNRVPEYADKLILSN